MKKITLLLFVFIFGCAINYSFAQEDEEEEVEDKKGVENDFPQPTTNVSKFFNDGKKSLAGNAIKFDATGVIGGNIGLLYERKLTNRLSLEAIGGVSVFNGFNMINLFNSISLEIAGTFVPIETHFYGLAIKKYVRNGAIDFGGYNGLQWYHKNIVYSKTKESPELTLKINSFRWYPGRQTLISKNVAFEYGMWLGFYLTNAEQIQSGKKVRESMGGGPDYGWFVRVGLFL